MWIGTSNGLNFYDPRNNQFLHFGSSVYQGLSLTNNAVRCITEDSYQNLLIGTNEGLNILNLETREIRKYAPKKMTTGGLNHFFIYSLLVDNAGTVWIGTIFGGINYFNQTNQQFRYYNPGNEFAYGSVGEILEHGNAFWIGTGGGGLLYYNHQFKFHGQYLFESEFSQSNSANIIRSIAHFDNSLLLSTEDNQLLVFDLQTKRVAKRILGTRGRVTDFYKTSDGKFLLCVNDTFGLRRFEPADAKIELVNYQNSVGRDMLFSFATCIIEESAGVYWVGTRYVGLYYYDSNKQVVKRFIAGNDSLSLHSNHISSLYIDNLNNVWIGTRDGGLSLFNRETETFRSFGQEDGLPNMDVRGILEDEAGYLWIATLSGVTRFDPTRHEFISYTKENGFPLQEVGEYAFSRLNNGQFAVGGNNGFTVFEPLKIKTNTFVPPVLITNFRLFSSGSPGDYSSSGKRLVDENKKIELKFNQANFIIEYTALNYIYPGKNQYAYKLEGFDTDWNYVGNQRTATFTNLNAGEYVFRVKASNNDGIWNESGKTLTVKIHPSPWRTWWAYSIYLLILSSMFFLLLHYLHLENKIKLKQIEQENSEKIHQMRIRMFTNFSHELRTPLTLIMGPVEDMLNNSGLPDQIRNSLTLVQKNTYRLLSLVNQLMDFRKQESGKVNLKVAEGRFNKFITEISMAFNALAGKKEIVFRIEGNEKEIRLWFDRQQLEKVFYNLLSNAFKNTPANGHISVSVNGITGNDLKNLPQIKRNLLLSTGASEFVETRIKNSGKGILEKELEKIFDPFYQVMDGNTNPAAGTGIGLSLVKGITEMHHGVVIVESIPDEWAMFRVILPKGNSHFPPDEIFNDYIPSEHISNYLLPDDVCAEDGDPLPVVQNRKKYTILLIDNNADIRRYIKSQLCSNYNIIEAADGKEGLAKAMDKMPDLIISDIMMPEIDGLQLCMKLKNELHTSHIPIILLTARTTYLHVKEGFEVGADDYIIKPFNANLLRIKVNSVLTNRERLKQSLGKKMPFELTVAETTSLDEQFLSNLYKAIEKNISNPDFHIENLSKEIGMSRASLYRKIKALTDLSANEFIKKFRLQVAQKYLRETDLSISEISYKTGFNNPAYFTNCFKKEYKMSPSKYVQSMVTPGGGQRSL